MKRAYNKPQILFESFELSQSIASNCEALANANRDACGYELYRGHVLFTDALKGQGICTTTPAPGEYDNLCYDAPADNNNVFTS